MANALARIEPTHTHEAVGLDMVRDLQGVLALAKVLGDAVGFLPTWVKTEGQAVAVLLSGRELGIPPMRAFRVLHSIEGKVELASSEMLALLLKGGVRVEWIESDNNLARGRFTRAGFPDHVETYTLEDAKRAQLSGRGNWGKHPKAMLRARCVSAAARWWAPDLLGGNVYAEGEIAETLDADPANNAASYSPEVRELGHALHDVDPAPEGADPLTYVMEAIAAVQTEAGLVVWVATHYKAIASEPDSQRKRDRWKAIQKHAAGLTPPVRTEALRRMFAEHAAKAAKAAKAAEPIEGEVADPVDELSSVETAESALAWAADHLQWLGAIPRGAAEEERVWDAIRATCDRIGHRDLVDKIEALVS